MSALLDEKVDVRTIEQLARQFVEVRPAFAVDCIAHAPDPTSGLGLAMQLRMSMCVCLHACVRIQCHAYRPEQMQKCMLYFLHIIHYQSEKE